MEKTIYNAFGLVIARGFAKSYGFRRFGRLRRVCFREKFYRALRLIFRLLFIGWLRANMIKILALFIFKESKKREGDRLLFFYFSFYKPGNFGKTWFLVFLKNPVSEKMLNIGKPITAF